MHKHIKELKDNAVKHGAQGDQLSDLPMQRNYSETLQKEITKCDNDEFYGKSLAFYFPFAALLCVGDILMGDYLAKEVLMAGPAAFWKGILLGMFCIALGVIIEIFINNIYNSGFKKFFRAIITIIPLLTLFMFAGMGMLRSIAINIMSNPGASMPPWAVYTFFIGMSLAAPTALGCVLFIIQKKLKLNSNSKHAKTLLQKVGEIINAEQLFINNRTNYAKDLSAEYDIGFHDGREEIVFKGPVPKPKPDPELVPQGSLADRLKAKLLKKHGFSILILFVLAAMFSSCTGNQEGINKVKNNAAKSIVLLGLSKQNAGKVLQEEIKKMKAGTAFSIIWPGGVKSLEVQASQKSSLVAQPVVDEKTSFDNTSRLNTLKNEFAASYIADENMLPQNWQDGSFRLFALVSEQFQGKLPEKKMILWLGSIPMDLLTKTDSLIRTDARTDVVTYSKMYSLNVNHLASVDIDIYIPTPGTPTSQTAEAVRRTCLYYRELFSVFDATVLSVKTINI
jgi:hypothetical protein